MTKQEFDVEVSRLGLAPMTFPGPAAAETIVELASELARNRKDLFALKSQRRVLRGNL